MTNTLIPLTNVRNVNDYLDAQHHIRADVKANVNDFGRLVIQGGIDFTLRELICNLLAGRGLKLPNLQICLSVNIKAILDALGISGLISSVQQKLYDALGKLEKAFNDFMTHTGIENVLGRINQVLAEVTQIANMINFCGKPLTPIAIPNVLENAMQSFLGKGKALIDRIGTMIPSQIGGCLNFDGGFNPNLFSDGILHEIITHWDRIITNTFDPIGTEGPNVFTVNDLERIISDIDSVVVDIRDLINDENNITGTTDLGGSSFDETPRPVNTELGVLHNPDSVGIQGNTRIASSLKSCYERLAGYPVVDSQGRVYDNIFQLILDDDMIELLRNPTNPRPFVGEQQPVFNYCGEIIGYTPVVTQQEQEKSRGEEPQPIPQPGFKANGLPTGTAATNITGVTVGDITLFEPGETVGINGIANTTNSQATEVLFDGSRLTIPQGKSWFYTITALGRKTNGSGTMAIRREGVAYNETGSVIIAGGEDNKIIYNNSVSSQWNLIVDDDTGSFRVSVLGDSSSNILWSVRVSIIEV
jgi:hypothetical protein